MPIRRSLVLSAALLASIASGGPSGLLGPGDGGPFVVGPAGVDPRFGEIYPGRPPARVETASDHARRSGEPLLILHEGSACDVDLDCVAIQTTPCGETAVASNVGFYQLIAQQREAVPGDVTIDCEPTDAPTVSCREGYCLLPDEAVFERFPERVPYQGGFAYATKSRRRADRWWGGETEVAFPARLAWPPPPPTELRRAALLFGQQVRRWAPAYQERSRVELELARLERLLEEPDTSPGELGRLREQRAAMGDALLELPDPGARPDPAPPHLGMACDADADCTVLFAKPCSGEPIAASTHWERLVGGAYDRLVRAEGYDCEPTMDEVLAHCEVGYCALEGQTPSGLPPRHRVTAGFAYDAPSLQAPLDAWKVQLEHMRTPAE